MTRILAFVAALICFALQPAFAADEACKDVNARTASWKTLTPRGYTVVKLILKVEAVYDAGQESKKSFYRFLIYGPANRILIDGRGNIDRVYSCPSKITAANGEQYFVEKTMIRVRALPIAATDTEYSLGTALVLPSDLVQRRPRVETTFRNGDFYVGTWGTEGNITTLTLRVEK